MDSPIDALLQNDPHEFKERIYDTLMDKLSDRFELERINVAGRLFGEPESVTEDDYEDEDEDEDIDEGNVHLIKKIDRLKPKLIRKGFDYPTENPHKVDRKVLTKFHKSMKHFDKQYEETDLEDEYEDIDEGQAPMYNVTHPDHGTIGTHSYGRGFVPSKPHLPFKAHPTSIPNGAKIDRSRDLNSSSRRRPTMARE